MTEAVDRTTRLDRGLAPEADAPAVPDAGSPSGATLEGALLFVDISGFTPLAEAFARRGASGAEDISRVLDAFFGELLAQVAADGGEPLKFAGDALFAWWPASDGLAAATHRAAACALAVQARLGNYAADPETRLALRVAVACGGGLALRLGPPADRHSVIAGSMMNDVKLAGSRAVASEVVLSPAAWECLGEHARGRPAGDGCWHLNALAEAPPPLAAAPAPPRAAGGMAGNVPAAIQARMAAGHGRWLAELRPITMLFGQILGLDPAAPDAAARLQQAALLVQRVVGRYDGFLKEITIDDKGVVTVVAFGVPPCAHEDDATRALRTALELRTVLAEAGHDSSFGIATGRAFCGVCGSDLHREYAVIGEVVNLAARLMSAAPAVEGADGILCDGATSQLASARVASIPLAALRLKGKADAVMVHRPGSLRDRGLGEAGELLGRSAERAVLQRALKHLRDGTSPEVLLLVGEAGVGKSRLAAALAADAAQQGVELHRGDADAIESSTPYHPWRQVFAGLLGIDEHADRATRRAALASRLGDELLPSAPLLEAVLGLGFEETPHSAALSGAARAAATQALLVQLLARAAAERPTAVLIEDGHWMDAASWSLALAACREIAPLLLAVTTRPPGAVPSADAAALQAEARCTTLALGPLPPEDVLSLVCSRLGVESMPPRVAELIRSRADGHPFFATELAYALRDAEVIRVEGGSCRIAPGVDLGSLSLPSTVQGAVAGRIDQLAPQEQLAIKVASVLGTSFAEDVLRDVHPVPQDAAHLHDYLEALVRVDLTVPDVTEAAPTYAFKHAITRDAAYDLMLYAQRRELHRAAAEHYEREYDEAHPELLAVLAHHWARAGAVPKAVAYLEKSAMRTFSLGLGRASVEQGLEAARLLGVALPTDPAQILPLLEAELSRIQAALAGRAPRELIELPALGDGNANAVIGLLLRVMPFAHQSQQAELFALMALRCMSLTLAHGHGPAAPVVHAMFSIVYRAITGNTRAAYDFARLALDLDERAGRGLLGPASFIYTWFNQHWLYPVSRGIEMSRQAAERALEVGDVIYGCFNLSAQVVFAAVSGWPLPKVIAMAEAHHARNAGRVRNAAFHCLHELQFAKALAGATIHPLSLSDAQHDEARDVASILATDQYNQIGYYHVSRLRLHYYYRDPAAALDHARQALACLPAFAGQVGESELCFFHALALLGAVADDAAPEARLRAVDEAMPKIERLRAWSAQCESNFRHKFELAEAERHRVEGDAAGALDLYAAAARTARAAGYVQHEALAHELRCALLQRDGGDAAREALHDALDAYRRWGAYAKVTDLETRFGRSG